MSDPKATMITVAEAAKRKGITRGRMYQFINEGRLKTFIDKTDGIQRVRAEDVDALEPRPSGRPRKR